jgi:alpha-tubulin suppressor-like RCC1 family protein
VLVSLAVAALLVPGSAPAGQSSPVGPVVEQIATGVYHSCAVLPTDALRCWGFSGDGQLGYGNINTVGETNTPGSAGPVDLGGHTVAALTAGDYHTCAILDDGTVRCWGYGYDGELGYGNQNDVGVINTPGSMPPVNLGTGLTATAISAGGTAGGTGGSGGGRHTCVILNTSGVECWGDNADGELGYAKGVATVGANNSPAAEGPVNLGGHSAKAIAAGGQHTCAILEDNTVKCWGSGAYGQLGYGPSGPGGSVYDPSAVGTVDLGAGRTAVAITAGDYYTCAILDDGSVECWGQGDFGQLGYGNTNSVGATDTPASVGPVDLGAGRKAVAISAGADHTCAILDNGTVLCWGSGANGQLGYGNTNSVGATDTPASVGPVNLGAGRTATAISVGQSDTCARLDDGSVQCWGLGTSGVLGHCNDQNVGATNTPGSVAPVDIGYGGAQCPPAPATTPPPATGTTTTTPTSTTPAAPTQPGPSAFAAGLRAQTLRANGFHACLTRAATRERTARERAMRRYRRPSRTRARLLRKIARSANTADARCVHRFGRKPGRVTKLAAAPGAGRRIVLNFKAVGSNGSSPPAARSYLIAQSQRPIRTARDFSHAAKLCGGRCTFPVTQLDTPITLNVTNLQPGTTYYYAVAARDNVTGRPGPRTPAVRAKTS